MLELDVRSMPICGKDKRLKGMLTDPDSVEEAIATRGERQQRRLPVIDGHNLVRVVSQADIARNYPEERVGELVEFISMET